MSSVPPSVRRQSTLVRNARDSVSPSPTTTKPLINGRTIWISDIHLGYRDCQAAYLLDFLGSITCDTLYLVGDIIDLWALKKRFHWPPLHYQVLLKLYDIANQGTRVIYVPGNHDEPLRHFHGNWLGPIEIAEEHGYETADGRRLLVMHGDAMDAYVSMSWITRLFGDVAYSLLLFANRWNNHCRKLMGKPYFSLAGVIKSNVAKAKAAIQTYQDQAVDEARRRGFDGVICGHIHCPALVEDQGLHYCNTGDWVESCTALVEDGKGQIRLVHYSDQVQWQEAAMVSVA